MTKNYLFNYFCLYSRFPVLYVSRGYVMTLLNLIGQKFGRLTVIERAEDVFQPSGRKIIRWLCQCSCGNTKIVNRSALTGGTQSCGCLQKEPKNGLKPGDKFERLTLISYNT